jgi:alkanesulfonate monooxygenase SsuD/methylene tetrahydromethanopterin reductase-like flavin-dependent oxidoreductase (luciferase family)
MVGTKWPTRSAGAAALLSGAADEPAFTAAGTPMRVPERAARLDEGLHVLTALWTGTPVRHHGRYYRLDGAAATRQARATAQDPHLGWR